MNEIIVSLFARLNDQIVDIPIFDHVLQDSDAYPYIQVVPQKADNNDNDTDLEFILMIRIMSFSRYRGMKETNDIVDQIYNALHQWSMPDTASYSVGNLIEETRQTNVSPDGLTRYSVQDFKMWVETI